MDYIIIFDVIIICLGAYVMYSAWQMKRKGEISTFIVNPLEIAKCKDKPGFIAFIFDKTVIFGAVVLFYGILALLNDMLQVIGSSLNTLGVILFFAVLIWYNSNIKKGKGKYFY